MTYGSCYSCSLMLRAVYTAATASGSTSIVGACAEHRMARRSRSSRTRAGTAAPGRARASVTAAVDAGVAYFNMGQPDVPPTAKDVFYATGGTVGIGGWTLWGDLLPALAVAGNGKVVLTFLVANATLLDADVPPCGAPFWVLPRAAALVVARCIIEKIASGSNDYQLTVEPIFDPEDP